MRRFWVSLLYVLPLLLIANSFGSADTFQFDSRIENTPSKVLRIAVGKAMKPYVLNHGHGVLIDIIKSGLADSDTDIEFVFLSNKGAQDAYKSGQVDAVAVVKPGMVEGYFSRPFITYTNYAIFLSKFGYDVTKIEDLKNYRVIAFSNARHYLGGKLMQVTQDNPRYKELVEQEAQVESLFQQKADIIISDRTIFEFYWRRLRNKHVTDKAYGQDVSYIRLFNPNEYSMAFRYKKHRDMFNVRLKTMQESGAIKRIYLKYTKLLQSY